MPRLLRLKLIARRILKAGRQARLFLWNNLLFVMVTAGEYYKFASFNFVNQPMFLIDAT